MNLVKNVGTKLDSKIKSGDIKESELMQEASELMNKMKDMPGMGNMEDMLNKMASNFGGKGAKFNMNAFNQKTNFVKNQLTGQYGGVPEVQRQYKQAGIETVVVGDHNYGEGSSREHAAMEPRFLGVKVVIVKSFARIHETNLKKQGMLGITFDNESDYDLIKEDDTFNFIDLKDFAPGRQITIEVVHTDGSKDLIKANHSYNAQQIEWFKEGSALNLIKKQNAA